MKPNTLRKLGLAGALAIRGTLVRPAGGLGRRQQVLQGTHQERGQGRDGRSEGAGQVCRRLARGGGQGLGEPRQGQDELRRVKASLRACSRRAEKCEKSLVKIGLDGNDISTINGTTEKTKLGKAYQKLTGGSRCRQAQVRDRSGNQDPDRGCSSTLRLAQLGWFPPSADPGMARHRCAPHGHGRRGERLEYPGHPEPRLLSRLPGDGQRSMPHSRGPVRRQRGLRPEPMGRRLQPVQVPRLHQARARDRRRASPGPYCAATTLPPRGDSVHRRD